VTAAQTTAPVLLDQPIAVRLSHVLGHASAVLLDTQEGELLSKAVVAWGRIARPLEVLARVEVPAQAASATVRLCRHVVPLVRLSRPDLARDLDELAAVLAGEGD
jgi:hypothetical protein